MDFELDTSHEIYIKITATGIVDKASLISAISQLMQHPEYLDKHSYWDFTNASMGLSIADLTEIAGVLRLYKPKRKDFANKSAVLVSGSFNHAMVNVFATMSKALVFNYRVFQDRKKLETFLCS